MLQNEGYDFLLKEFQKRAETNSVFIFREFCLLKFDWFEQYYTGKATANKIFYNINTEAIDYTEILLWCFLIQLLFQWIF